MEVSESRGPQYSTLSSSIRIMKDSKIRYPVFSETPTCDLRHYHRCTACVPYQLRKRGLDQN